MTIILAGYKDDIEKKLYGYNAGMASRFQTVVFDDFTEKELGKVLFIVAHFFLLSEVHLGS